MNSLAAGVESRGPTISLAGGHHATVSASSLLRKIAVRPARSGMSASLLPRNPALVPARDVRRGCRGGVL